MLPIRIIGGGLAGLSLAIGLRRVGVPVQVKEAGHYPRHRVCGEFISGLNKETIHQLGLAPALRDAVSLKRMRWYDTKQLLREDDLPFEAKGISRWMLDQKLAEEVIASGGELETGTRCQRDSSRSGVVDSAGRQVQSGSEWLGLKCHLDGFDLNSDLEMHMSPNGYVGLSRIEHGRVNLCGLFRNAGLKPHPGYPFVFQYLRECGFEQLLERVEAARPVEGSDCSVAALGYGKPDTSEGLFRLGDARGLIPPFTGNGMTIAFESAALAVEPLHAFSIGAQSWASCTRDYARMARGQFSRRLVVARMIHRLLVSSRLFPLTVTAAKTPVFPFDSLFRLTR